MSTSTFKVLKQCLNCGDMFESQRITTKYCSHKCNQRHYKLRKKLEKKENVKVETLTKHKLVPKIKALDIALIRDKEFLNVKEVALLFGCDRKTVYRMIDNNIIHAVNLNSRMTRIRKADIDSIFNPTKKTENSSIDLKIENCYSISQIKEKYKISDNGLRSITKRNNIPKAYFGTYTYYPKKVIDNLFSI
ncbi:helix-turn-helix domain-containing protein [Tenacibaculum aiptasiae]|uniref:helix-turn-helix domain-containing protein n=1 Tax=Tenacibaculum aiptasiae TaxID=426481 RepID=UPI00232D7E9B|nr:helix-turn-helix domain-containing protein [Tenacibaculum aiptasiae]